ncbi:MAG: helix-turn-helix domain-containing protein [Candidatus Magnetominusculus sp. LBB02]|nr:helix-turn-helix domain-containing protein [Candidatus Magnetominusculus sp. LBB02]
MIKVQYLQALEDENFKALPCEVYTKGYIRVYLEAMSYDSTEGMRIFNEDGYNTGVSLPAAKSSDNTAETDGIHAEPFRRSYAFTLTEADDRRDRSKYSRQLVYLLIFLAFLAVVVYSSYKLLGNTKRSNASVIHPVDSGEAMRNKASSSAIGKPPQSAVEMAVPKSPDSNNTELKPETKTSGAQPSDKPALNSELKDLSKIANKMKDTADSLKSLKKAVEKKKSAVHSHDKNKPHADKPKSREDRQPSASPAKPSDEKEPPAAVDNAESFLWIDSVLPPADS